MITVTTRAARIADIPAGEFGYGQQASIAIHTSSGLVQHYQSAIGALEYLNRNGRLYEMRGNEVWHKGHNSLYGVIKQ